MLFFMYIFEIYRVVFYVFQTSNVHNERNINFKFVILVRIRLNGFSGEWSVRSEKIKFLSFLNVISSQIRLNLKMAKIFRSL